MKAPRLQVGDTVGIVSPSWGGASVFPHRLERGIQQLEALGFKVKIGEHARNQRGFVSDTAENRAQDIHKMFADSEVKAIFSAIGGDHSCHLLPHLDFDLIHANPKIFVGYSDTHILSVAIWKQTRLVTFVGPAVLTDFAEFPSMFEYTRDHMMRLLTRSEPIGRIEPSPWWTEEFLDWSEKKDLERPRMQQPSDGWVWLKGGQAEGVLIGGRLESLQHLRGTRFWPDWEKGLLVGRPMYYTDAQKQQLREVLLERTRRYDFPIIMNMDFGHTAPQFTLPIGCRARIDIEHQQFEIIESAVE